MDYDEEKISVNIRNADTDDLLDRMTAYRAGMEPDAIDLIERELHRRGVTAEQIAGHREECERECVFHTDGTAKMCSFCRSPAVRQAWGWHRLLGKIPVFPRLMCFCKMHAERSS